MKFLIIIATLVLAGCSQQIKDFIGSYHRGANSQGQTPAFTARKITSGSVFSSGSQIQGQMVLKPTGQKSTGTHVDAVLSLNQQSR